MKQVINLFLLLLCVGKISAQTESRGVVVVNQPGTRVFAGNIYAVIVGVSNYKYVRPLSFADQDALLFKEFLQSKAGGSVRPDNIFLVINQDANASTQPRIRKWLTETKKIQKGDRVYFYFAGHGDAINPDEYFFLLQDCNPGGDKNNYTGGMASVIQMYNIKSLIKNDLVNNGVDVLLIWDACRSNELPGGEAGLRNIQDGIVEKTDGESIMLSASAGEAALESSNYAHGHGLFTYYLVDGLSGAADNPDNGGNGDGKIDISELSTYVTVQARKDALLKKLNLKQSPVFINRAGGDETLSIVDSSFENDWAMQKASGSDLAVNNKKTRNVQEADSLIVELYNKFMAAVKADSLNVGRNSAEELYKELLNKYPENSLTEEAGFNLAMEYINVAQDKINLYLSGKDDLTLLATPKADNENHNILNQALTLSYGKNYGRNAQYLYRALELLRKDSVSDVNYMEQLKAKAEFLAARSYVSNEGIVTNFSNALQLAKAAMSSQPQAAYNYLLLGSLYYINNQFDSSIYYERKALELAPKWVNALNSLGLAFDAEKKYDSAQIYYRKAIAINPDYLSSYGNLSYNFSSQQLYDSAYKYSRESVILNHFYAGGYNSLGIIFHFQKKYDSSKFYYYKTISIDPTYAAAYNNLGILFYNEAQYDSAKKYYHKTIDINPEYIDAYYNLGIVFNDLKQHDSATSYYYKTLSISSNYKEAFCALGAVFNDLKQYDSAGIYYHKALDVDPNYAEAYYDLGILFYAQKQYDSAKSYYRQTLNVDPKYANAFNGLGNTFFNDKQSDSAELYYHKALRIDPKSPYTYYNLGALFYRRGQYDSAKYYYWQSLSTDPKFASGYFGLGNVFLNKKLYDSAKIYFEKVIKIDPKYIKAYTNLGTIFFSKNQNDSAKFYFYKAINIDPKFSDAYYLLGLFFITQKQNDTARYFFYKTISYDPKFADAYLWLGNTFKDQNQYDSAKIYFKKTIGIDPGNTDANNNIGLILIHENQYDSSAYFFKKMIINRTVNQNTFALYDSLAVKYEANKMYDKELELTQLLYNYDSAYHVSGVDSRQKRILTIVLAYTYLLTGNHAVSKYYYEKDGDLSDYYYNVACIASLNANIKEALENLELSFQKGYKDYDHIQIDTDLDKIRNTEEFKQLLKRYFPDKPGN